MILLKTNFRINTSCKRAVLHCTGGIPDSIMIESNEGNSVKDEERSNHLLFGKALFFPCISSQDAILDSTANELR